MANHGLCHHLLLLQVEGAVFRSLDLRSHIDVSGWTDHGGLIDLSSLERGLRLLDDLAARAILTLGDGERYQDFRVVQVIFLEIPIVLIIFNVVEKCDPLLVLVVFHDRVV